MSRILLVDDEPGILRVLGTLLKDAGYEVETARLGDAAIKLARSKRFDVVLSDIHMEPMDGLELLTQLHKEQPNLAVIMLTAQGSVTSAVEAMRQGAFDYVTKPFKMDELLLTVGRALQYSQVLGETIQRRTQARVLYRLGGVVAECAAMRKVCEMIERIAPTDATALIVGEDGSGKKLVAKTIHEHGRRKAVKFLVINCADPAEKNAALFASAAGGTVLLENVESLQTDQQVALLDFFRDRAVHKPGAGEHPSLDIRVLAATSASLEKLVEEGKFDRELFGRLGILPFRIPPLRERPEEILPLAQHFMRRELGAHADLFAFEANAATLMEQYSWPGNVRELQNVIHHVLTQAKQGRITKEDLPAGMLADTSGRQRGGMAALPHHIKDLRGRSLKEFLRAAVRSAQERAIADAAR